MRIGEDGFIQSMEFYRTLQNLPYVEKIILYGSRARKDEGDRSDIDIAIDCPSAMETDWLKILDIVENADTLLKIDCVRYDTLSSDSPLRTAIDKDGLILYMKDIETSEKLTLAFSKVEKALASLEQMVNKPMQEDRSNVDACIQRFEFSVELFWKLLKRIIESKGQEVTYPRDVLQAAYQGGLIDEEASWLLMLKDRNLTSHTYDETLADQIYSRIKATYYPLMQRSFNKLKR